MEVLGGGLIHEQVLKNCGINTIKYSGYAMGGGLERIALLTHHIDDLRLFAENNIHVVSSLDEATALLRQIVTPGDTVLFENDLPDNYTE